MAGGRDPTTADSFVRAVAHVDASLAPGQVLERTYQLVQRVGGGGMGVVYRARDLRLGRDVAIKVLKADEPNLRRMFEREARTTAQLLHPNIVTLHHVGEHLGHPYLVLELLGGETVAERLARRGPLPLPEALAILDGILAALAFAHERGVLHRDIKPSNVFITLDERIKVLDFGVAFSLATAAGTATRGAGTPGYMAPEQSVGASQDARTDLWSAVMLFVECILGRHTDLREAAAVVPQLPAPPAVRDVLARALAIDPAQRPASAAIVRQALGAAHVPVPPSAPAPPPTRHARWPVVVVGVLAVAGIAIAIAATRGDRASTLNSTTINNTHDGADIQNTTVIAGSAAAPAPTAPASAAAAPAPAPPASAAAKEKIDTCKTAAAARVWANAEQCAHELAAIDPALSAAILAQVKLEVPNEAIAKQIPAVLEKQGLAAARALAAKLSPDSVYVDDAKTSISLVESIRSDAVHNAEEGDCAAIQKQMSTKIAIYELAHVPCQAEPGDAPCKAQDVLEDARFEYNRGEPKKALAMLESLIACRKQPVSGTYFRALEAACMARDEAAAKRHYAQIEPSAQRSAIRFCHTTNIALP